MGNRGRPGSLEEVFVIQHPQRGGSQFECCVMVMGHPSAAKAAIMNRHDLRDEHFKTERAQEWHFSRHQSLVIHDPENPPESIAMALWPR